MNILPKKRWHVRTKENIARVRRDEAEAAEKEKEERLRIENADREARLNILKHKSKEKLLELGISDQEPHPETSQPQQQEHINLFVDLEHAVKATNKDHDKEVKEKKEEYEKKIGYLTYLGQDTNEALKKKNWYEVLPDASRFSRSSEIKDTYDKLVLRDEDGKSRTKESDIKNGEVAWKAKQKLDPLQQFSQYCTGKNNSVSTSKSSNKIETAVTSPQRKSKHKHKSKKHKKDKDEKQKKLLKLREERLKREQKEKLKTEMFLSGLNPTTTQKQPESGVTRVKPKYNSQFNPELARQNYT
ncbi:leukocyte receptor cluster member 1 homolog [Leguminivora glycinivorella]|uniref:leukocyte receptor cluster member 1 homolog n=1 Tax=Leguminivora glycinivorella TaxID=1035111 RepID=UPI00200FBFCF|nr:leukocyte receptor cluster member 1 homolog [Leguminivora glycinivorella]